MGKPLKEVWAGHMSWVGQGVSQRITRSGQIVLARLMERSDMVLACTFWLVRGRT